MRNITYRGPGTGLRLDGDDGSALDTSAKTAAVGSPMTIYVSPPEGATTLELSLPEVVLLAEACGHYIARETGVPVQEKKFSI